MTSSIVNLVMRAGSTYPGDSRVRYVDLYTFDDLDLSTIDALVVSSDCDQIFLERRRERLTAIASSGGRIA
ncbi:hypothetical protein FFI94_019110 [Rhodococcus sp. KBS0724]|uniref:hypothetical protein n=1 Tax=Rhodococcus sp. KBS0724 TaxID=1179674 RepID=UPI00110EC141|nr:hypothetical protein [Rhodococcus sp. KBS0724]TSD48022.1 hypothetical protein FFI94_019110 [Rhodococcus sp. KBS0724]